MKLEYLEYIVEIANQKSISKAANNLHMAQPALSAILNNIEAEIGFPIFHRTSRGVTPTLRGQKVITDAPNMLNIYYDWKSVSGNTPADVNETVNIAAFWLCCSFFVPRLTLQLQAKYPNLQVDTQELSFQSLLNQIRLGNNDFSIALLASIPDLTPIMKDTLNHVSPSWEIVPLYQDNTLLYVGEKNPYFKKKSIEAEDFPNLTLIEYYSPNRSIDSKPLNFNRVIRAGSTEQILSTVVNSDCVAFLPASLFAMHPYMQNHRIKTFSPQLLKSFHQTHYLVHKPSNRLTIAEKIVLREIKASYSYTTESF